MFNNWATWVVLGSVVMFVGSLAAIPPVVIRLPADYLLQLQHEAPRRFAHPVLHVIWVVVRNVIGIAMVIAGVVMLVTPGQGVLTIVVGLLFMDLPGKRQLIVRIMSQPKVFAAINKLRKRFERPPLMAPQDEEPVEER